MAFLARQARGLVSACGILLVRLPARQGRDANARAKKEVGPVVPYFPIVGALIGGVWCGLSFLSAWLGLHYYLMAALLMFVPLFASGFTHLASFIRVADSLAATRTGPGSPKGGQGAGVASAVALVAVMFAAALSCLEQMDNPYVLIFIPIASRALCAFALENLKPLSGGVDGLRLEKAGDLERLMPMILFLVAMVAAFFACSIDGVFVLMLGALASILALVLTQVTFRGISLDTAGFALVIGEAAALILLGVF